MKLIWRAVPDPILSSLAARHITFYGVSIINDNFHCSPVYCLKLTNITFYSNLYCHVSRKTRTSLSDITAPILGSGTISATLNSQSSKMDTMSPNDPQASQARPIYDTLDAGEHDSNNILHANLFLCDSFVNYNSDTNLDGTNACLCITGERKRHTLSKEPIGFLRNNDVCQCGLGIFEREKLRQHTGLFSSELLYVSSCMENMGVTLDARYCDTSKRKRAALHLKKESVIKDLKPVQSSELLGTSNSTVLVDNLLDQFSSPLSASATFGKLGMTGLGSDDTGSPLQMRSGKNECWT